MLLTALRKNIFSLQALPGLYALLYGAILCFSYTKNVTGPFINSYPHITNDGYDLIFQGHALYHRLTTGQEVFLPVLRQPTMVFIWFFDRVLASNGIILFICNFAAYYSALILLQRNFAKLCDTYTTALFLTAYAFLPFHELGLYVLTEEIGIMLGILGFTIVASKERWSGNSRWMFISFLAITAGGLTKTYALIPGLMALGTYGLVALYQRNIKELAKIFFLCIAICMTHIALIYLWRISFTYGMIPNTFSLLKINSNMTSFYLDVFGFLATYFLPLLMGALLLPFLKESTHVARETNTHWLGVTAWIICLLQILLAYFYQYEDTRFIYLALPYFLIGMAYIYSQKILSLPFFVRVTTPIYFILFIAFISSQYGVFGLKYSGLEITPGGSWYIRLRSPSNDFFELQRQCHQTEYFCKEVAPVKKSSGYKTTIIQSYVALLSAERDVSVRN